MVDRVGQRLGNYQLIRLLGEGGFAEVYLGEHIHLGTQAAIKVLHTQLTSDDVDKFRTEARTIARLIHPHIVRVLEFGVEDKTPFLVMDYASHGSLRKLHPRGVALPLATIVHYLKQVASALQYAHDQRVIHRDVKPENMLVGRNNDILLSDFGIALVAQSSRYQSTQKMAGTMAYMAPEQIQGKPRPASDQYSLGIVIYEWLSGDRPFHGSLTELVGQHLSVTPSPLREKVATILPDVEQVVMTALAKDPRQRFGSVQAFATALEQASQAGQSHPSVLSQAPTVPSQPLQPLEQTFPAMPLSQQTMMSSPGEVAHTSLAPSDQSRQSTSSSDMPLRPGQAHQGISRRTIVLGLGVVGLAVAGGGLTLLVSSQGKHPSVMSGQTPTTTPQSSLSPTPIPLGTLLFAYRGHSLAVEAVAWSPDGSRIVSGSYDQTVQVWDAVNGGHVYTYRGHSGAVWHVAWSPDGKRIASASGDRTVQVWDATTGKNVYTYRGHPNVVTTVGWSPDGKRIVSGSDDHTAQVWDATTGQTLLTYRGHSDHVESVVWSPGGKYIASGSLDTTAQVWDATMGQTLLTYREHSGAVLSVAWSPNGKRIASASFGGTTVQVWGATTFH